MISPHTNRAIVLFVCVCVFVCLSMSVCVSRCSFRSSWFCVHVCSYSLRALTVQHVCVSAAELVLLHLFFLKTTKKLESCLQDYYAGNACQHRNKGCSVSLQSSLQGNHSQQPRGVFVYLTASIYFWSLCESGRSRSICEETGCLYILTLFACLLLCSWSAPAPS